VISPSSYGGGLASTALSARRVLDSRELENLRNAFTESGYVVVKGVVCPDRLRTLETALFAEFSRVMASGQLFSGGGSISGHLNCFPGSESRFAYDALEESGLIHFIKTVFPKANRLPNVGCNFNLPKSVVQHYHADRNFLDHFVIANVAVVDTDVTNGAIDLIPGTHRKFYKYWRFVLERAYRGTVRVPMARGDVLLRSSNMWHRGMPNDTNQPRPMLAFTWEDGGSAREDPFSFNDGQILFRENWFRPTRLGRVRERTFVAAPITYSVYRFVTSMVDGTKGYDRQ
jgi:hypothetical protein